MCTLIALAVLGSVGLLACGLPDKAGPGRIDRKENTLMAQNNDQPELVLAAAPRGEVSPLVPEQSATFDLVLRNETEESVEVLALEGNPWTPEVMAYDDQGNRLMVGSPLEAEERAGVEMGEPDEEPPEVVTLAPGEDHKTWVDLWDYTDPFPKGRYAFEAVHQTDPQSAARVTSNRVAFEVVDARVSASGHSYESSARMVSTLAWLATPLEGNTPSLLIRLSAFSNHAGAQNSGTSHGAVPVGSKLAVGQLAPGSMSYWTGWVAVVGDAQVELIHHNMTAPMWRSGAIALPLVDAEPAPRFPDRGHAVFLATGSSPDDGAAVLTGVVVAEDDTAFTPWSVPLLARPTHAACAFSAQGAISLLFASKEHERTNFSRLEVEETGAVSVAEHPVYSTYNELLAVAVDMRPNAPLAFLVLEADPEQHDHLTLVHIPLTGDPEIRDLGLVEGWPFVVERVEQPRRRWPDEPEEDPAVRVTEVRRALRAVEVSLEVGLDGTPWLALVDEQGSLYGGRLDGPPLALLRQGEPDGTFKATKPHAAALARGVTLSAFTETGALFHAGVR